MSDSLLRRRALRPHRPWGQHLLQTVKMRGGASSWNMADATKGNSDVFIGIPTKKDAPFADGPRRVVQRAIGNEFLGK